MAEYAHSIVLFSGDDGLPLEFNIKNIVEKESLKAIIEHGGGMCSLSDGEIYLVNPGTKVLNVDPSKKLISTRFIYDCIKENCLLNTDEYRIEINELETSDFSDNSANLIENVSSHKVDRKSSDDVENSVDILETNKALSPNLIFEASNHAFDFEDTENRNKLLVTNKEIDPRCSHVEIPLESCETHIQFNVPEKVNTISVSYDIALPDSMANLDNSDNVHQALLEKEITKITENKVISNTRYKDITNSARSSPVNAVIVSSSQPNEDVLDQFDNVVLSKVNESPIEKFEDSLSQSYTVSSSADAQVSSPKLPSHHTSAEIFEGSSPAPDSASQTTERQQYIKNLEREIEQILEKPSKTITDKIILVKYICCVKKLAPALVLRTLQKF